MRVAHYIVAYLERSKAFIAYVALYKKGKRSRAGSLHTCSALFHRRAPSRRQASLTGVRQASQDPSRLFGHDHDHRLSRWFDEAL